MKTLTYPKFTDAAALTQQITDAGIAQTSDDRSTATDVFFGCGSSGAKSAAAKGQTLVYAPDSLSASSEATINGVVANYVPPAPVPTTTSVTGGGTLFTDNAQSTLVGAGVSVPVGASLMLTANVIGSQSGAVAVAATLVGAFRNNGAGAVQAGATARLATGDVAAGAIDFAIGADGLVYVAVTGLPGVTVSWSAQVVGTLI
jgi:hypothetical protein